MRDENVLVCRRADLPAAWLPDLGVVPLTRAALLAALKHVSPRWLPRREAEHNADFKQWIPYVLLESHRGRFATYARRGTEHRLHGLRSLGIGGHVNPEDAGRARTIAGVWRTALRRGCQRELREEFPAAAAGHTRLVGLINEEGTSAGRVHLGVVFHHRLDAEPAAPGGELGELTWVDPHELGSRDWPLDRFETWSRLALRLVAR